MWLYAELGCFGEADVLYHLVELFAWVELDLFDFDDSDDCIRGDFASARQRKGKNMRKIDFKNLLFGIVLFCAALAIGILLIFRLTHRGHIGIGPVRFGKLFIIMCALLFGSIYFFKRM